MSYLRSNVHSRVLAATVASAIALAERPALAQPAAAAPEASAPVDTPEENPALGLSRAHFKSGLAAYEREDYYGAIDHWEQAHALMASVPELIGPRHIMQLDLAQAHLRAHDRDGRRAHLDSARELLESYVAWLDRPGHTLTPAEREDRPRALAMLARIDVESSVAAPPPPPRVVDAPRHRPQPAAPSVSRRTARGMIVGGSVSLGLAGAGVAGLIVGTMASHRAEHDYELAQSKAIEAGSPNGRSQAAIDADRRGARANGLIIASATFIALGTIVGIPLLGAGLVARRRNLRAAPTVGRGYAGAQLGFAF